MLSKKIVKYIQSLSHKKFREAHNAFVAEGPKIVSEFLNSGKLICNLLCAEPAWLTENQSLLEQLSPEKIYEVENDRLQSISQLKTPNRVVAVFEKRNPSIPNVFKKVSLMLDDIQDPGNFGTIIRIADWFGIENIICSEDSVDCYNSKVVQATMGSLVRVNIFYTDLIAFIHENKNVNIYAAALSGVSVFEVPKIKEGIILIGNESKGIHENLLKLSQHQITIPRYGQAESLNAAVASGIILSQMIH